MSLDRQAIEKRDFPISRRGYETLAVDAHLAQLAREVEALQAERLTASDPAPAAAAPSLANSASEQDRAIVQAAERSAAEIEQQATDDAARQRSDAASAAEATRASAESDAQAHVSAVQGEARSMLERIEAVESLLEHLRTTAQEVQAGLDALHAQVGTLGADDTPTPVEPVVPAPPVAAAPIVAVPDPVAPVAPVPAPEAPVVPEATSAASDSAPAVPPVTPAPTTPAGAAIATDGAAPSGPRSDDEAGARMVALSLVLDGLPRDQIERHLDAHYALDDRDGLLDDLYARQAAQ